ncbi:undecaprenyl-diphosphate phosphatase [Roseibacillus persicicus]|uniref:Undecaprenyl-diphosphatase n=1 Tax=Roseibacillus persicicus TaxID=454148 RepID=A0A918TSB7_9BACT|nr:undecaprenyl-diphosphate phosphatase [Roseibacillus persicicus]GHC61224.1 undecaprenyl-diphosphatase [Roseibacillus persicicus]
MEIWEAIVVGVVQGLAEFLPISSSGHIVLTQFLLGMRPFPEGQDADVVFEVILHVGTLLSVLVYFWKKLWRMTQSLWTKSMVDERKWIGFLALATLPAVVLVLTPLGDVFESAYENPFFVSGLLLITGALLLAPKVIKAKQRELSWKSALVMGVGQAFAILPGISRSGSTITAGLLGGVEPKKAAEFAFLMSIPAIAGAVVFKLDEVKEKFSGEDMPAYFSGAVAAFLVGLFAVYVVMKAIQRGKFQYFAYYCFVAGVLGMIWFGFVNTGWKV